MSAHVGSTKLRNKRRARAFHEKVLTVPPVASHKVSGAPAAEGPWSRGRKKQLLPKASGQKAAPCVRHHHHHVGDDPRARRKRAHGPWRGTETRPVPAARCNHGQRLLEGLHTTNVEEDEGIRGEQASVHPMLVLAPYCIRHVACNIERWLAGLQLNRPQDAPGRAARLAIGELGLKPQVVLARFGDGHHVTPREAIIVQKRISHLVFARQQPTPRPSMLPTTHWMHTNGLAPKELRLILRMKMCVMMMTMIQLVMVQVAKTMLERALKLVKRMMDIIKQI